MGDVEWSNHLAVRLMKEYEKRPELWDSSNELYRVQTARYEAWADLASIFECDIAELRKKMNSLLASHRREKAKVRTGRRSQWFLYPYMKFLPTHLKADDVDGTTETNNVEAPEQSEAVEYLDPTSSDDDNNHDDETEVIREEIVIKSEPEYTPQPRKRIKHAQTHKPRLTRVTKKVIPQVKEVTNRLDRKVLETLSLLRRSDLTRKKDECDSFGEYIAISLRKHDDRTQSMIKQAINNILFEQEMKKYSVGQYAVVISGVDENPLLLGDQEK